jgi:hypothetical protein
MSENQKNHNQLVEKDLNLTTSNVVLDTRYLSYIKLYILDILSSEFIDNLSNDNRANNIKSIIKVNNTYCSKVSISGLIVGVYESEKYYRLKIDDSTGSINVTFWKTNLNQNDIQVFENTSGNCHYDDLYYILNNIKAKINEKVKNNKFTYEPKQGDLVMINANIKNFRGRVELNAVSCVRITNSTEEIFNMSISAILNEKIYSTASPSHDQYENILKENEIIMSKKNINGLSSRQNLNSNEIYFDDSSKQEFISLVYKALIKLSQNSIDQNNKKSFNFGSSCDSYDIFMYIRKTVSNKNKLVTYKQVLAALKELELTGLVYSCEDEYHFLPIAT